MILLIALAVQLPFFLNAQVDMTIVVTFDQAPTTATAIKAPLKYNKDFALSMQIDDGNESIFTYAFPVFMGGNIGAQSFPGLSYTDGCGNEINFKMSTAQFTFNGNGENGPDTHVPGSGYGMVSWPQMDTLYNNGWGIINHGVNGDANTSANFMEYSLNRNKSYTRRKLQNTTEGGVLTRAHVNPNGQIPWSQAAFDLGYFAALNQDNMSSFMGNHGGNINSSSVNWLEPQNLYRLHNNDINVTAYVGDLADSSTTGANYWGAIFTHSIAGEYPFNAFYSDFSIIASNYGSSGSDNILMAPDEEIINYLLTRESLSISSSLAGSSLFISLNGDLPNDMRYYALSLVINADENISNITVIGADSVNHSGYGSPDGLINLFWDGEHIIPSAVLSDSMTTIAANTQQQRDGWVAMDYVITMENSSHKDSLRNVLCNIPGTNYDEGFCDCAIELSPDTTICEGNCDTIYGPDGFDTYQWIVTDTVYDTTQNIFVCPADTTQYILNAENEYCLATDTIVYNVNPSPIFYLGNDTTLCLYDSLTIYGPDTTAIDYTFEWIVADTLFDTTQNITVSPTDTTLYILNVTNSSGCIGSDSIWLFILPAPVAEIIQDDTINLCIGDSVVLTVEGSGIDSYLWNTGDTTQSITANPAIADSTYKYYVDVFNSYGCSISDTSCLIVNSFPEVGLSDDSIKVCRGELFSIDADPSGNYISYLIWNFQSQIDTNVFTIYYLADSSGTVYCEVQTISGCNTTDSTIITVNPPAEVMASENTEICKGDTTTISATGADFYYWFLDGDTISNNSELQVFPDDTSKYFVVGEMMTGCKGIDSVTVAVSPLPQTAIIYEGEDTICKNTLITLIGGGADYYLWSTEETSEEISFYILNDTLIELTGSSNAGCSSMDSLRLFIIPPDTVRFSGLLPAYCENDLASILLGEPEGGIFSGSGIVGNEFSPTLAGSGEHTIKYTYTNEDNCTETDSTSTVVYGSGQEINIGEDQFINPNETIELDAGEGFNSYYWSTGSTYRNIMIYYTDNPPGSVIRYVVMGVINGCSSQGETNITFVDPDGIGENTKSEFVIFPNPNNGVFTISYIDDIKDLKILIYDYYGKLLFARQIECNSTCETNINLSGLSKGLYIIKTLSNKGVSSGKLIVN